MFPLEMIRGSDDMRSDSPVDGTEFDAPAVTDGRRLRYERNRQRIIEAMKELVRGGDMSPSAEAVADRAGVGMRSVFRHFEDMESLYRQMRVAIMRDIHPLIEEPFSSPDWRAQLDELVDRKIQLFEEGMMYYMAGKIHMHNSTVARADHEKSVAVERKALRKVLPDSLRKDRDRFEALDLALSFDSWVRLRQEQGLSIRRSKEVLQRLIEPLLADA